MKPKNLPRIPVTVIKKILKAVDKFPNLADARSLTVLLDIEHWKVQFVLDRLTMYKNFYTKEEYIDTNLSDD